MIGAIATALAGLNRATEKIDAAAGSVAAGGDTPTAAVEMLTARAAGKADLAVIKAADAMVKATLHLLDVKA